MEKLVLSTITEQTNSKRIDSLIASPIDKLIDWTEGKNIDIYKSVDGNKAR